MKTSRDFWVVGGLLALAIAVGGAGVTFPRLQMMLQAAALCAALYFVATPRIWSFPPLTRAALVLAGLVLALPLLQLVPLPPSVWTHLPGRDVAAQVDAALGMARWRPLSLDVEGTLRSFLTLIPPLVVFVGCLFLPRSERTQLLWIVVALAGVSALAGVVQLATSGWLTPYPSGHRGYPVGLFVNRNHNAALLLAAIPVVAAVGAMEVAQGKPRVPWVVASLSAIVIFALVVVGTTSRMGFLLLPLSVAAAVAVLFYRGSVVRLVVCSVAVIGGLAALLLATGRLDETLSRFSGLEDSRFTYWTDIQWALDHYGFVGTGFGTFIPVYKSAESLEAVVPQVTNHAHNDYLEVLLEGGVPAALLFCFFLGIIVLGAVRAFNSASRGSQAPAIGAAVCGIVILLAASAVDYPLRMAALSSVFALFCALLLPVSRKVRSERKAAEARTSPGSWWYISRLAAVVVLLGLFIPVAQAGLSAQRLAVGQEKAAARWASWSTEAHERLATKALLRNDLADALSHGRAAIALSPISAPAIRSVGLARATLGDGAQAAALMQAAVGLGWRDPLTQLWAIEAAKASREPEKAAQRAEALYRQGLLIAPATAQLLGAPAGLGVKPILAAALANEPSWRANFFEAGNRLPPLLAAEWLQLVSMLERTDAPVSMEEGRPSLDALLSAGQTQEAQRLWELLQERGELISNGRFEAIDSRQGRASPAHWSVPRRNQPLVTVRRPDFDPANQAVQIAADAFGPLLRQEVLLSAGNYVLSFRARVTGERSDRLHWELLCGARGRRQTVDAVVAPVIEWQRVSLRLTVPDQNCATQRLALKRSRPSSSGDLWIDEIRIQRVPR